MYLIDKVIMWEKMFGALCLVQKLEAVAHIFTISLQRQFLRSIYYT